MNSEFSKPSPEEIGVPDLADRDLTDPEEARDLLRQELESGQPVIITIPPEYAPGVRIHGLEPRPNWNPAEGKVIRARIGDALIPQVNSGSKEARIGFQIDIKSTDVDRGKIIPVFTGPKKEYRHTVEIKESIPPELLRELSAVELEKLNAKSRK